MVPQPIIRDWARRLIASEVGGDQPSARTERVYEKLRTQLRAPMGTDGFQALACRALSLAKSQAPRLNEVQVLANGGLTGLDELESELDAGADAEVGIILIAQLLGLFLTLLGEAATVGLVADVPLRVEMEAHPGTLGEGPCEPSTNYFGPFENISLEAEQLRNVSERLESLADTHPDINEVMSVAGSIRNIAAVLDVFTLIRSKGGSSSKSVLSPLPTAYLN